MGGFNMEFKCCMCGNGIEPCHKGLKLLLEYINPNSDVMQELYVHMDCFERSLLNKKDLYIKYLD